ncbi:hypothetical protein [Rhodococcus erythropolis]|uniref:hypothetical protein n=1 Tax=Rhodococcus erythropolis TaxID=1833 RepID=UPI002225FB7F|nr:hypothetical protein [Rhodococcus erythropolis]MCW2300762.1 hypothetical protein [Rhodococcus erythropolis]
MSVSTNGETVSQIFLSCDLTGSTDFKQSTGSGKSGPWQKVFLQFYREFPQRIATTQVAQSTVDLSFELWKPIGDELIYTCAVRSEADVYRAVRTWIQAMKDYEKYSLDDTTMGTKGGAFIATFPGPDSRSSVPRDPQSEKTDGDVVELNRKAHSRRNHRKYLYDYFGPSIDTGFRVLSKCDSRYFTLSVEVAFAMSCLHLTPALDQAKYGIDDLVLLDSTVLKGVWGGRAYPVLAIDTEHLEPVNLAYSAFEHRAGPKEIQSLCQACYGSDGWPSRLYLPSGASDHFKAVPVDALAGYVPSVSPLGAEEAPDELAGAGELSADPPLGS